MAQTKKTKTKVGSSNKTKKSVKAVTSAKPKKRMARKKVEVLYKAFNETEAYQKARAFDFDRLPLPKGPFVQQTTPDGKTGPYCQVIFPTQFETTETVGSRKIEIKPAVYAEDGLTIKVPAEYEIRPINRTKLVKKLPLWVRITEGDNRNGRGYIYISNEIPVVKKQWPRELFVRWAGGSAQGLARACESVDVPVPVAITAGK